MRSLVSINPHPGADQSRRMRVPCKARSSRLRLASRLTWWTLAAVAILLAVPATAFSGEYTVAQCHERNHATRDMQVEKHRSFSLAIACDRPGEENALKLRVADSTRQGRAARLTWQAPVGTRIVGVKVEAKLRSDSGYRARVYMADAAGLERVRIAKGKTGPTTFRTVRWSAATGGTGRPIFGVVLICERDNGCPESKLAKAWIRQIELTLRDTVAPKLVLEGSLLTSGWKRHNQDLIVTGTDIGGGVSRATAQAGSELVVAQSGDCSNLAGSQLVALLRPCEQRVVLQQEVETTEPPFREGENNLHFCVRDFGIPAAEICESRLVRIDNVPPTARFTTTQVTKDPELIRANVFDETSGLRAGKIEYRPVGASLWVPLQTKLVQGQLHARVDSQADPPGRYEFRATVSDVAGNETTTNLREDGTPMILEFPLKTGTHLGARFPGAGARMSVPYRRSGWVRGRLTDAHGRVIAGAEVVVTERFDSGSLVDERVRRVTTGERGRYRSFLPGGPSRRIRVSYDGTRRYIGDRSRALDFNVGSAARLATSRRKVRAGRALVFRGRVKRYFARIPDGGKLVEIQVKEGRRQWGTVREAFTTNARGRYRLRYRFGTFYVRPTTFKFRLKVARERGWPYRAPVRSKTRKVTIVPR